MVWGNWALGFAGPGGGLVSNIHGGGLPAFFDTTETDEARERERESGASQPPPPPLVSSRLSSSIPRTEWQRLSPC